MEVDANTLIAAAAAGPSAGVLALIALILQFIKNWRGTRIEQALSDQLERQHQKISDAMDRLMDQNDELIDVLKERAK